jgi:hypothetical protein
MNKELIAPTTVSWLPILRGVHYGMKEHIVRKLSMDLSLELSNGPA